MLVFEGMSVWDSNQDKEHSDDFFFSEHSVIHVAVSWGGPWQKRFTFILTRAVQWES